nr:uncharacterized protein LOC113827407 [Penaeus vannamei]
MAVSLLCVWTQPATKFRLWGMAVTWPCESSTCDVIKDFPESTGKEKDEPAPQTLSVIYSTCSSTRCLSCILSIATLQLRFPTSTRSTKMTQTCNLFCTCHVDDLPCYQCVYLDCTVVRPGDDWAPQPSAPELGGPSRFSLSAAQRDRTGQSHIFSVYRWILRGIPSWQD